MIEESIEEHALAEIALGRLLAADPKRQGSFAAKVTAASDLVDHHVEEEEKELFPKVAEKASDEALSELGKRMKMRFQEALKLGFDQLVPRELTLPRPTSRRGASRASNAYARDRQANAKLRKIASSRLTP